MLIPNTLIQAGGGSGAITLISTTVLGADGTFDITGIAGSYNDLWMVLIGRGATAAGFDIPLLTFNNDSGANYDMQTLNGGTTSATSEQTFGNTSVSLAAIAANTAGAGLFDTFTLFIPGYASTLWNKNVMISGSVKLGTGSGQLAVRNQYGHWRSTSAITRVTIQCTTSVNFLAGSTLRIYGLL